MHIPHRTSTVTEYDDMKPKAVGLVRTDKSGLTAPQRAIDIRRHAEQLGYRYLYTVRPPDDHPDPIGYALSIAFAVHAAAIVIYDPETVDNTSARVCDACNLETACPPTPWAAASDGTNDPAHARPDRALTVPESHRIMQQHRACRAALCPRKASALGCLVKAGKVIPPTASPRERAAARGLPFPIANNDHHAVVGPDAQTLIDVLEALAEPRTNARPDYRDEPESIRERLCTLNTRIPVGYKVDRKPAPPYGWNLRAADGTIVSSGSPDIIESAHRCRGTSAGAPHDAPSLLQAQPRPHTSIHTRG
ncbi:hypothetical protein KO481_16165 [Nocardia sp. NEAU-G5]|uniref:4Fe-4S Wbl-type domain-containing protein n=1 Tax=Nocardia albiluteola TaxID=2842303 RepID=A0ABS6B1A1_9NOCA|nr:hypothetical protein [Nocardia albiluteola]MBU3063055.1 hypothetical protein [Nocardia albiluteola]